jgi:8-oxo-dGTP pyrophosphatase MutT (NUDIX family)
MVLRPTATGFEIFMARRHSKSRFLPDRFVFPGGRLEPGDSNPAALARLHGLNWRSGSEAPLFRDTPGVGAWDNVVPLSQEQQAGLWLAALRELFEEAGVLLAVDETTGQHRDLNNDKTIAARFAAYRKAMAKNELDFIAMLEQEKLLLDTTRLVYYSHWVTPVTEPYRFDARFFLTQAPPNQTAASDNFEIFDGIWISPQEALRRYKEGSFNIIYPTRLHIERLANFATAEAALAAGRAKMIVPAMPDQLFDDEHGNPDFLLPEDILEKW